jgi:hypothetical protein
MALLLITYGSRRLQLSSYCSHILEDTGGNDILGGGPGGQASALELYKQYFWGLLGKPVNRIFTLTIDPVTLVGASNEWTSTGGQGASPYAFQFTALNSWLRTSASGVVNVIDTARVQEPSWSGTESFVWGNLPYHINSFTYSGTEVVANLAATAGLNAGDYVAVTAAGGGGGTYAIRALNGTPIELYQSVYDSTWSGPVPVSAPVIQTLDPA